MSAMQYYWWLSLLVTIALSSQLITAISANNNYNFESAMLRGRNLQSTTPFTIPPFSVELGYIISSHSGDPSTLLTPTQQHVLESSLQSSLIDHLSSYYYNTISLVNTTITTITFLPQSTDPNLQRTTCLTPTACQLQNQLHWGGTLINTGAYPFKGCFRRKNNHETVLFGTGGNLADMSTEVLNDNLERVFCYERRVQEEGEELVRRGLDVNNGHHGGASNASDSGNEESDMKQVNNMTHRKLSSSSSVQSAKLTVLINGGQLTHNSNSGPTGLHLRDTILNQITTIEGQRAITSKLKSQLLQQQQDSTTLTLTTLLTDLDTIVIAQEQPTFIEERYQSVRGCPRNNKIGEITTECTLSQLQQHSTNTQLSVHCCTGTLGINLTCRRPNCRMTSTHSEAVLHCSSKGMRVCTVEEMESNVCCDGGCGFNSLLTWTLDVCSLEEEDDDLTTSLSPSPTVLVTMASPPTSIPSKSPTFSPTLSLNPTSSPPMKVSPTSSPTGEPPSSSSPSNSPVITPITLEPTLGPSKSPIASPTVTPTISPTIVSVTQDSSSSPSVTTPNSSSSSSPTTTYIFEFPTPPPPPILFQSPTTTTPSLSPSTDNPNPLLPVSNVNNIAQQQVSNNNDNNNNDNNNIDSNNNLIIAFASAGSLILILAIALGLFAMRKHHHRTHHDNKDPSSTLQSTTFHQSDFIEEEMVPNYNYDDSAAVYPSSLVESRRPARFGIGSSTKFGTSPVRNHKYQDRSGGGSSSTTNRNSMLWKDQPLSCQDGNGTNPPPIDDIVDDMALDFLAGTDKKKNNKSGERMRESITIRDFRRPKLLSSVVVAPFKAFRGEDTEEDDSDEVSKTMEQQQEEDVAVAAPPDFRPKLMDTSFEALQGEKIDVDSDEGSLNMGPKLDPDDAAPAQEFAPRNDSDGKDETTVVVRPDNAQDGHLILGDIYKAAKKSRREREGKGRKGKKPTLNDKVATDLRAHRAKMNSFLEEDAEPELGRRKVAFTSTTSKTVNHHSLPQRLTTHTDNEGDDTDKLKEFSFNVRPDNENGLNEDHQSKKKKKVIVSPTFGKRNRVTNRGRALYASPDRRFFTYGDDDDDESDEYEDKSRIPNLIMADDKSGFASAVSSIGQLDWRGRERSDRRAQRVDKRKKQRDPSVDTMETDDAGAKMVACQNRVACRGTLHKTKNILSETLERSLHCKTRVVSPTSDINDDDEDDDDDNQVSRPWKTKWDSGQKGKSPPPVEDAGYQSSDYDPDSDWDVDDNDLTVDYSAEGSFMPSPLKGVGFDLKR